MNYFPNCRIPDKNASKVQLIIVKLLNVRSVNKIIAASASWNVPAQERDLKILHITYQQPLLNRKSLYIYISILFQHLFQEKFYNCKWFQHLHPRVIFRILLLPTLCEAMTIWVTRRQKGNICCGESSVYPRQRTVHFLNSALGHLS